MSTIRPHQSAVDNLARTLHKYQEAKEVIEFLRRHGWITREVAPVDIAETYARSWYAGTPEVEYHMEQLFVLDRQIREAEEHLESDG